MPRTYGGQPGYNILGPVPWQAVWLAGFCNYSKVTANWVRFIFMSRQLRFIVAMKCNNILKEQIKIRQKGFINLKFIPNPQYILWKKVPFISHPAWQSCSLFFHSEKGPVTIQSDDNEFHGFPLQVDHSMQHPPKPESLKAPTHSKRCYDLWQSLSTRYSSQSVRRPDRVFLEVFSLHERK